MESLRCDDWYKGENRYTPEEDFDNGLELIGTDQESRRRSGLKLVETLDTPESETGGNLNVAIQGRNLLLANWGASEPYLRGLYRYFYELKNQVHTGAGQDILVLQRPLSLRDLRETPDFMPGWESGGLYFYRGRIPDNELCFRYEYQPEQGYSRRQDPQFPAPYLMVGVSVQLEGVEGTRIDIADREIVSGHDTNEQTIIKAGSTLRDSASYHRYNLTEALPFVIGTEACDNFEDKLRKEYMAG